MIRKKRKRSIDFGLRRGWVSKVFGSTIYIYFFYLESKIKKKWIKYSIKVNLEDRCIYY